MKREITRIFLLLSLLIITSDLLLSQENPKINPSLLLQYFKDNNDSSILKATLTYSKNRMEIPLKGMKVALYSGKPKKVRLAEIITDEKGISTCRLKHDSDFSADENGLWPFSALFEGNDTIQPGSSDILIKDVTLRMELTQADSIRTVSLNAVKTDKGTRVPVSGDLVTVYVPRMFSLLPVGEITLDNTGSGSIQFPADLPGDKDGNLTVIARFEEHPEFGNIEKRTTLKWGVPSISAVHAGHRALWTKTAPKWMIYTLSILLTGVWGHYLFAIISLIRIRIDAKRKEEEDNYGK